jgi:HSP20 family protein
MADQGRSQARILGVLLVILAVAVAIQSSYMVQMSRAMAGMQAKKTDAVQTTAPPPAPAPTQTAIRPVPAPTPQPQPIVSPTPRAPQPQPIRQMRTNRWDPWEEMRRMRAQMARGFSCAFSPRFGHTQFRQVARQSSIAPTITVEDAGDSYIFRLTTPGQDKPDVQVEVKNQILTIAAKQDKQVEQKDPNGRVICRQHSVGQFQRSMRLWEPVDADKMTTKHENGVFTITLPKAKVDPTPQP